MAETRLIQAVAGAGKTYYLVNSINIECKNIIITYTNRNVQNIINEFTKIHGYDFKNTLILTYDKFLLDFFIKPYILELRDYFGDEGLKNEVSILLSPRRQGPYGDVLIYKKGSKKRYYDSNGKLYLQMIEELLLDTKINGKNILQKGLKRNERFIDAVFIDEFQDFRINKFKVIMKIAKYKKFESLLVGDYYQHSVCVGNSGAPYKKKTFNQFKDYMLNEHKVLFDDTSLINTRRCGQNISTFVRNKFAIDFNTENTHDSTIKQLSNNEIIHILNNDNIVKLVYNKSEEYIFNCVNWSYSKGDTYDDICIILTEKTSNILDENWVNNLSGSGLNKAYVAFTRAKNNIYLINKKDFDIVKSKFTMK